MSFKDDDEREEFTVIKKCSDCGSRLFETNESTGEEFCSFL